MRLVDSHCHLQSLSDDEREAALERARARGVRGFLVPATRLDEAEGILAFCARHDDVWCALGVHPHEADSWRAGDRGRLRDLAEEEAVVAIGECGLDFHYENSPREVQGRVMREQWELACELDLPVVVHNRDSDAVMIEVIREPAFAGLRADFHSFAGSGDLAEALHRRGFTLGFSGMVTFKGASNVREALSRTPHDRLLVETDTPYLAPVPYRGKRNEPAYVVEVATRVAEEIGASLETVAERTTGNFFELFRRAGS